MKKSEFHFEKVVVGGNLSAVAHSYYEGVPLIFDNLEEYFFFDKLEDGIKKSQKVSEMLFISSLAGLVPFSNKLATYRVDEEEKEIKVYGKRPFVYNIKYDEVYRYDQEEEKENEILEVIDWIDVISGMKHEHGEINTEEDFVKKLMFYQSDRIDPGRSLKDVISFSYLTRKQVEDIDYSEFYVRLKTLDLMKQNGIKGTGNGFYYGKQRYLPIKIEWDKRNVRKIRDYSEDENLKKYDEVKHPYMKKLLDYYGKF